MEDEYGKARFKTGEFGPNRPTVFLVWDGDVVDGVYESIEQAEERIKWLEETFPEFADYFYYDKREVL